MTPAEDKTVSWDENHVRGTRKMSTVGLKYVEKPSLGSEGQTGANQSEPGAEKDLPTM